MCCPPCKVLCPHGPGWRTYHQSWAQGFLSSNAWKHLAPYTERAPFSWPTSHPRPCPALLPLSCPQRKLCLRSKGRRGQPSSHGGPRKVRKISLCPQGSWTKAAAYHIKIPRGVFRSPGPSRGRPGEVPAWRLQMGLLEREEHPCLWVTLGPGQGHSRASPHGELHAFV